MIERQDLNFVAVAEVQLAPRHQLSILAELSDSQTNVHKPNYPDDQIKPPRLQMWQAGKQQCRAAATRRDRTMLPMSLLANTMTPAGLSASLYIIPASCFLVAHERPDSRLSSE